MIESQLFLGISDLFHLNLVGFSLSLFKEAPDDGGSLLNKVVYLPALVGLDLPIDYQGKENES